LQFEKLKSVLQSFGGFKVISYKLINLILKKDLVFNLISYDSLLRNTPMTTEEPPCSLNTREEYEDLVPQDLSMKH
jgi:hypothetical protein